MDKKNQKIQYKIIPQQIDSTRIAYSLYQDELFVGETTPTGVENTFNISSAKYGNNLKIKFHNQTDFSVLRDGEPVANYAMTSDVRANLDIAKGERRNFSFAVVALFIFWTIEKSRQAQAEPEKEKEVEKENLKESEREKESEKEKENEVQKDLDRESELLKENEVPLKENNYADKSKDKRNTESSSTTTKRRKSKSKSREVSKEIKTIVIPKKGLTPRDESDPSEEFLNAEESSGNSDDEKATRKNRRKSTKTPRAALSARSSIPLRAATAKSPRINPATVNPSTSRKTESSNSVLNAILQKKKAEGGEVH